MNASRPEQYWRLRDDLPKHKIAEFRRRSIANTFKEVIFSDPQILSEWLSSDHAATRIETSRDPVRSRQSIEEAPARVMYGIGGFGRVPDSFENWFRQNVK